MRFVTKPFAAFSSTLLLALSVGSSTASAGGYELNPQSPEVSGAADAATARSGTPSSAHYNPAALVDGAGLRVGVGMSFALSQIDARSAPGAVGTPWSASTVPHTSVIPSLFASYAHRDWMVSLAVYVPYGSHVEWPADWAQRFDAVLSSLKIGRIAPSFGYRFGRVRIAGGVHLNVGELESQRATDHIAEEGSVDLLMHGTSIGGHVGLFVEAAENVDLGFSYQSRSTLKMHGDADFDVPPAFQPSYPDQGVSTRFPIPDRFAFGSRFGLGRRADLFADFTVSLWSVNDVLVIDFEDPVTDDSVKVSNWRTTGALRVGSDVRVVDALTVRGGAFVDGLWGPPPPASTLSPTSPDSVRVGGSVGLSWNPSPAVSVDAYYQYLHLLPRESTSQDAPLARYEGHAHLFGVGARFFYAGSEAAPPPEDPSPTQPPFPTESPASTPAPETSR